MLLHLREQALLTLLPISYDPVVWFGDKDPCALPYISWFYSERLCGGGYMPFPVFRSSNISTYSSVLHINQNYGKLNFLSGKPKWVT